MCYSETILAYVERQLPVYQALARDIHAHPETSNHEYHACGVLSRQL